MLVEGSAIAPEVLAERGVRTVKRGRGQLPSVYSWRQKKRAPGVLFIVHRPNGETSTIFRPDEPDPNNPGHKYEQPSKRLGGPGNVLDVHPSVRHQLDDTSVPVLFVEGVKKADSIISAARAGGVDLLVVAISGVWNFLSEGEPIADMYDIPVDGREAIICFDSDLFRKPEVQGAAERLAGFLEPRGADVSLVHFSDQPDGSKTGADDFLASEAGGTIEELLGLARPFEVEDVQREKLSRNERLRRALDYLSRSTSEMPARSRRDCSKRAAWRACLTLAERRGRWVGDGVEVRVPAMTGAELAAMSQPTFSTCMTDLVEDGRIRRIVPEQEGQAYSYVLLVPGGAVLYNYGGECENGEGASGTEGEDHPRYKVVPPLPELRWSSPGRKARRGLVRGTRRVRRGKALAEDVPSVRRPGKKRGEIVRYLVENGGTANRAELLERFGGPKTTWRDFKRQQLAELRGIRRQYKGQPLSVGPPVVELDEVGVHLVDGWQEALEQHRWLGGEEEATIHQKIDHLRQRAAYHARSETKADRAPTEEEMAEGRDARHKRLRVERLVHDGMAPRFAAMAAYGADGFVEELRTVHDDPSPPSPAEEHPLSCECLDCSARMPRYVTYSRDG